MVGEVGMGNYSRFQFTSDRAVFKASFHGLKASLYIWLQLCEGGSQPGGAGGVVCATPT